MHIYLAQAEEPQVETHTTTAEPESAGGSPLAALGINPTLFVFQLINFAIVASIIWFLILKPLTKKMSERQKLIDESIDNAKRIEENLKTSEQKYQEKIDEAKKESVKILEKAQAEAEKLSIEVKTKAKEDIEILVDQAKIKIRNERDEMVNEVKEASAGLIVSALEKIIGEKIDGQKDRKMIDEMIGKLK